MKKKYKRLILIGIILVIGLIGATAVMLNQESKITAAESYIAEGKYEEAVELLNNLDLKKKDEQEKKEKYLKIINEFGSISKLDNTIDKIDFIEKFKNTYKDTLNNEIFNKLNKSVSSILKDLNERKAKIEELTTAINKCIENEEMEAAKSKIAELTEKYTEVSIKELKNDYDNKEKEIEEKLAAAEAAAEEERKAQQLKEEEEKKKAEEEAAASAENKTMNDNSNNSNVGNEIDKQNTIAPLSIADTSAAQNSSQLITVVSSGGYYAELKLWQKDGSGNWQEYDSMTAMLGSGGLKAASQVYEMDMCTPTGSYSMTEAFGVAQNPGTVLPYRVLDGSEYWIDDPDSAYYNTMQFGEANGRWNSAEHLTDYQNAYQYSIVVDYNRWPVVPGKSSAIFLHCDVGIPTWGCIAVAPSKMVEILNWIEAGSNIRILLDFSYENIFTNY